VNQTTLQPGANFNIDGTGTANIVNATTHTTWAAAEFWEARIQAAMYSPDSISERSTWASTIHFLETIPALRIRSAVAIHFSDSTPDLQILMEVRTLLLAPVQGSAIPMAATTPSSARERAAKYCRPG
jgi:hypothetical protein